MNHYDKAYWSAPKLREYMQTLSSITPGIDVVLANDIPVLPLAVKVTSVHAAKLYLDAHEYEPLHYNTFIFNFFFKDYWTDICRRYLPKVDHMTTVCDGIAKEYEKNFDVKCEVVMNLPYDNNISVRDVKNPIRMIHHGIASPGRQIESMIQFVNELDKNYTLDFMMLNMASAYGRKLQALAKDNPRIRFLPTVPMTEIPEFISKYDLGIFLLPENTFNHKMALPNKFFEFIQARLGVVIWPSQEMKKLVDQYGIGCYSDDFTVESLLERFRTIDLVDIKKYKENADKAARVLNDQQNREYILSMVENLVQSS
jgi:hypothetical protein